MNNRKINEKGVAILYCRHNISGGKYCWITEKKYSHEMKDWEFATPPAEVEPAIVVEEPLKEVEVSADDQEKADKKHDDALRKAMVQERLTKLGVTFHHKTGVVKLQALLEEAEVANLEHEG